MICCNSSLTATPGQGPKLTFLGRRQLATEYFFLCRHMEKCGRQKVLIIKFFLHSETQIDVKLWWPIFLLRIRTKPEKAFSE